MVRFIVLTFALLGVVFYEMSGGADFEPASARLTDIRKDPLKPARFAERDPVADLEANVTRVALNLTTVEDVLTGGATQPARNVEPLSPAPEARIEQVAFPAPRNNEIAAIIPSLVEGADSTTFGQFATINVEAGTDAGPTQTSADIRSVTGTRVNVRGGPGTDFNVVTGLVLGDEVEVLEDTGTGWVQTRPLDGGPIGWVADFLLSEG